MTGAVAEVGSTANNYQILARLATGGMAEIFLARGISATGVERYCVLKRILRSRASDAHFVRMFLDEARLAAQLQHANVAQVYDIGKLGDSYFFTMEYVHGETVRSVLQRARSLRRDVPLGSVLTVIAGAAAGLHHAHERIGVDGRPLEIVHRDVSPSNLMVSYEGGVKVVDFGVAKASDRMSETRAGTVKGKISYLSPEQCRGLPLDRRSDVFSLGIVFWEMLATERLYRRASDFENMTAIVGEPPPLPSSRRAQIPPEIDAIAMKMLAKDPAARYQTADEVVEALEGAGARANTMLSPSALGRFLRDMFGQRPEPWLDLGAEHELPPDGVTVTSEPIPKDLGIPVAADVDLRLSGVPDLSEGFERVSQVDDSVPPVAAPVSQLITAQTAAQPDPALAPTEIGGPLVMPDDLPTGRQPPVDGPLTMLGTGAPAPRARLPSSGPPPVAPTLPPYAGEPRPSGYAAPSVPTMAGPGLRVVPGPTDSGSYGFSADASYNSYRAPAGTERNWKLIAVVGAAALIGSLTVYLAMRGDDDGGEPSRRGDVASAQDRVDAAQEAPPPPVHADAAEARLAAVDAAEALPADAAEPVREAVDAAVVETPPDAAPMTDEITALYNGGRFPAAVAACVRAIDADHAAMCTLAACSARDLGHARPWLARVAAARRPRIVAQCRDLGVDLSPPKRPPPPPRGVDAGVDPCEVDPASCQR